MTLFSGILAEPSHLLLWVLWLIVVNSAALFFLGRVEARAVLAAWVANAAFMIALAELNGYNRFLGLSHVVIWTPLLVYLWRRRRRFSSAATDDRWLRILFVTNALSLAVDVVDVCRYLLGEIH